MKLSDYSYQLPESRIAKFPLEKRENSKLLVYEKGQIRHNKFGDIVNQLPSNSSLYFNNTKVIPARVILYKEEGARIEIFLLEPLVPSTAHEEIMNSTGNCVWKCFIGNAKKWKQGVPLKHDKLKLTATRIADKEVLFKWENGTFSEILTEIGKTPLPPYIDREVDPSDKDRYQTVYSKFDGAVAAPTAGLHFTEGILNKIQQKGINTHYLTLHVSAGTFQPFRSEEVLEHKMHNEQVLIDKKTVKSLLESEFTIAVGTTSMRTLESLYWYGVVLEEGKEDFYILQDDPYKKEAIETHKALQNVLDYMERNGLQQLRGQTEIFIYPGYDFKICKGLITNFHFPNTTLVLLIAAFLGEDWRRVYDEALQNEYRFLSYGDSSLLLPK